MNDFVAGKILDAYRASPLITGLLMLNVGLALGFGWWEWRRVERVDAFVQQQLAKQDALQERLLQMAKHCTGGAS